jgi:hypothetical protein
MASDMERRPDKYCEAGMSVKVYVVQRVNISRLDNSDRGY